MAASSGLNFWDAFRNALSSLWITPSNDRLSAADSAIYDWFENKCISLKISVGEEVKQLSVQLYEQKGEAQELTKIRFTDVNGENRKLWAQTQDVKAFIAAFEATSGIKLSGTSMELKLTQALKCSREQTASANAAQDVLQIHEETLFPIDQLQRLSAKETNGELLPLACLLENSANFQRVTPIPTQHNQIAEIIKKHPKKAAEVVEHLKGTRPILHERTFQLIEDFLAERLRNGSAIEKALYSTMDSMQMIDRLLRNRPISFVGGGDSYRLRDNTGGHGHFETIGTDQEREPLILENYMSYPEIAMAALVGVSVPTHFINTGSRGNRAIPQSEEAYEPKGIYVGLIGARFERPNQMEWRHMLITPEQNSAENGYGVAASPENPKTQALQPWAKLYGQPCFPSYAEAQADTEDKYIPTHRGFLHKAVFKERIKLSIVPFLYDANLRAKEQGKSAYVHVVGLGLGVWQISPEQGKLSLEAYAEVLSEMDLSHIADLDFSWFQEDSCGGVHGGEVFKTGDHAIAIHFSKRDPAAKLTGADEGKLLVAMYAWDGNAFPGNEYWGGALSASGDPAAACCSTIPELQNPEINPNVSSRRALIVPEAKQ